jgi:hypothetical protein
MLGLHESDHGKFEVEALSREEDRILLVMLSHQHSFYERDTPADADRRTFHGDIISAELTGQREFLWGEVICRFEPISNQDWLVTAYNRDADIPPPDRETLLRLFAHEKMPE